MTETKPTRTIQVFAFFKLLVTNLRHAVMGQSIDYTQISIKKAIFFLSIPMMLEMIMESIFAVVDIFFVSRISSEAIATVGLTESIIILVYAVGIGIGIGTSAIVARRVGEKNTTQASHYAAQGILLTLVVSGLITLAGFLYPQELLRLMGAEPEIVANYYRYTQILLSTSAVILLLFVINAIFRSAGKPALSMKVLIIANSLNIVLDPLFIFGWGFIPAMGIEGAAIATSTGRGVAVLIQLFILFRQRENLEMMASYFKPVWKKIKELLDIAVSGIGQILIITVSWLILTRIVAIFGSDALAAYTISIRVFLFFILPVDGISNAVSTLVGQNLGAQNPTRAEQIINMAVKITVVLLIFLAGILFVFAEAIVRIFEHNPEVVELATELVRIFAVGMTIFGFGMVYNRALNGAGDTITPTKINFLSFIIVEIPVAYILSVNFSLNVPGVVYAVLIADLIAVSLSYRAIKKGKWKTKKV